MPCRTCGKDCKCLRMMSKRSCGSRACDSGCTCSCNASSSRCLGTAQVGSEDRRQDESGQLQPSQGGCACTGGGQINEEGTTTTVGCGDSCSC